MQDELIRNKLSFLFDSKQIIKQIYTHEKWTIQASPKWGKRGVGAIIPLALY